MDKRIFKQEKNKKDSGFTMAELLITVAIVLILAGVGVVAAMTMLRNARQASNDKAAEAIFADVQNYMQEVFAFEKGNANLFTETGDNTGVYVLKSDGKADDVGANLVYSIKTKGDGVSGSTMGGITNDGSVVGKEFYNKGLVIEYNPTSGQVHSVFYADTDEFSYDAVKNDSSFRSSISARMERYNGYVGYYESNTQSLPSDASNGMVVKIDNTAYGKSDQLYNYDELKARLYCKLPKDITSSSNDKKIRVTVRTTGLTSEAVRIDKVVNSPNVFNIDTNSIFHEDIIFDSLKENSSGKRFKDIFGAQRSGSVFREMTGTSVENPESGKSFIPGENIKVKVTVEVLEAGTGSNDGPVMATASDEATDNSLFAYDGSSTDVVDSDYKAYIGYGRHLQNLDRDSGIEDAAQISKIDAVQVSDVYFNRIGGVEDETEDSNNTKFISDNTTERLWADDKVYGDGEVKEAAQHYLKFIPIRNSKINSYDGEGELPKVSNNNSTGTTVTQTANDNTDKYHAIKGLYVDSEGNAGLFESFGGESLKNIRLENARIKGTGDSVGGLAGEITSSATIEGCRLYMKSSEMDSDNNSNTSNTSGEEEREYNDKWLDNWNGGTLGTKTAYDASDWLSGNTNVGGLVGKSDAALTIKNSFAATVVNATGAGSYSGGLVGNAEGTVNIEEAYEDCYISGKNIGGLVGACAEGSTFNNCYSAGFVMSQNKDAGMAEDVKAGSFVPSDRFSAEGDDPAITGSYSLFNFTDFAAANDYDISADKPIFADDASSNISRRAKEIQRNGLKVPYKEGDIGADQNEDDNDAGRGYYLSRAFVVLKNAGQDRLEKFRVWDKTLNNGNGGFRIDYTRYSSVGGDDREKTLTHYNDWMPDDGQDIDLEIINTEKLAFRIKLENEPSSEAWKVYLKGITSGAERILEISKNGDAISDANNQLVDVKASDFNCAIASEDKTVSFRNDTTGTGDQEEKLYTSAWIVLDALKNTAQDDGWTFGKQFGVRVTSESASEAEKKEFIPGEDILISWGDAPAYEQGSEINIEEIKTKLTDKDAIVNSLFSGKRTYKKNEAQPNAAPVEKKVPEDGITEVNGAEYQAKIAYGRQLQNLDSTVSGFDAGKVKGSSGQAVSKVVAQQLNDIYFDAVDYSDYLPNSKAHSADIDDIWENKNADKENAPEIKTEDKPGIASDYKLQWNEVYKDRTFIPVTNDKLESYDGEHKGKNKDGNDTTERTRIVALNVKMAASSATGDTVSADVSSTISKKENTDQTNAGLFGTFNGKELKNITLVSPRIAGVNASGGNTGGLAGVILTDAKISGSRLYMRPVYEENVKLAGGDAHNKGDDFDVKKGNDAQDYENEWLVGGSNAGGMVGESKSNLEIKNSFAATIVNGIDGNAGGLVGKATKLDVSMSYADCYVRGKNMGGLAGECSNDSKFKNCYAAGFVLGSKSGGIADGSKAGAFVPNDNISAEDDSKEIEKSYSLFYFADITEAEYSDGEADFDGKENYSPQSVENNGLTAPDRDEIERLNGLAGIGDDDESNTHAPYYLAKYFQRYKGTGRDRLKKFVFWDSEKNDGKGGFRNKYPYPRAGLPHYGDWLTTEATLKVYNDVMLYARLRIPVSADNGEINMTVTVDDDKERNRYNDDNDNEEEDDSTSSKYKATLKLRKDDKKDPDGIGNIYRVKEKGNEYVSYYVILDDITTEGNRFTDIFSNNKVVEEANQRYFYPGVNITEVTATAGNIEVTAKDATPLFPGEDGYAESKRAKGDDIESDETEDNDSDSDDDDDEYKKHPYWNTLYANGSLYNDNKYAASDLGTNKTERVFIKNFRHLENLDRRISGRLETGDQIGGTTADDKNILVIKEADQRADLIWLQEAKTKGDDAKFKGFVDEIWSFKEILLKDDDLTDNKLNDGVSIYSSYKDSAGNDVIRAYNDKDENSYMPVNMWLGAKTNTEVYSGNGTAANTGFVYDAAISESASSADMTDADEAERYTINNLYVKAPEYTNSEVSGSQIQIEGLSAGKNYFSEMEKAPDDYYLEAGVFGFVEVRNGAKFSITNLKLNETDIEQGTNSGGLIGRVNLVTVSEGNGPLITSGDVIFENIDIAGDTYVEGSMIFFGKSLYARGYAGGFTGTINEIKLVMNDCHIYGKKAFVFNESNDDIMTGAGRRTTIGGGSAGGIVASAQWCSFDIDDTSASCYVYGEEADTVGGFFGRTYGNYGESTIKNSYVGAHTKNGAFQQGVFRKASSQEASNVVGYNCVGGFIGYIQSCNSGSLNIEDCFSVASVYSTWKDDKQNREPSTGGFIAYINNSNGNKKPIAKDCYMAGRVYVDSGYYTGYTGLFVGKFNSTNPNMFSGDYVLDMINHRLHRLFGEGISDSIFSEENVDFADTEALARKGEIATTVFDSHWKDESYPYDYKGICHYYGDWEKPGPEKFAQFDLQWSLINKDKLEAELVIPNDVLDETGQSCFVTLKIKGSKTNKTYYAPIWIYRYGEGNTGELITRASFEDPKDIFDQYDRLAYDYDMDDVNDDLMSFKSKDNNTMMYFRFDDITNTYGHFAQLFTNIKPGDDLEISFAVGAVKPENTIWSGTDTESDIVNTTEIKDIKTVISTLQEPKMLETNSLFGFASDVTGDTGNKAEIRWGRHLQNLDPVVSGINPVGAEGIQRTGLIYTSAEQTKDIDWNDFVEYNKGADGSAPDIYSFYQSYKNAAGKTQNSSIDAKLSENGEYYGVYNINLKQYMGNNADDEDKMATVSNIVMNRVKELSIGNFINASDYEQGVNPGSGYKDRGNSAGLFRYVVGEMDISNLRLNNFDIKGTSASGIVVGKTNVVNNSNININKIKIGNTDDKLSTVTSTGDSAGGLIGSVGNKRTLTIDDVEITGTYNITANKNCGGFVGNINGGTINVGNTKCSIDVDEASLVKTTSTTNDNYAGGMFGQINKGDSNPNVTINNTVIKNLNVVGGKSGGFIGCINDGFAKLTMFDDHIYGEKAYCYANNYVGGFIGCIGTSSSDGVDINSCSASVYVASDSYYAGGFIGQLNVTKGNVENCYVGGHTKVVNGKAEYVNTQALTKDQSGNISLETTGGYNVYTGNKSVGGFIGYINSVGCQIDKCYTTASVSGLGDLNKAGFCGGGPNNYGKITNCYAAGKVFKPEGSISTDYYCFTKQLPGTGNMYLSTMENNDVKTATSPDINKLNSFTSIQLEAADENKRATNTVRFDGAIGTDGIEVEYKFPFYTDADSEPGKTFYGDWASENVLLKIITTTEDGNTYEIYFDGTTYYTPEKLPVGI